MKKAFSIFSLEKIQLSIRKTYNRFPIALSISVCFCLFLLILLHNTGINDRVESYIHRGIFSLVLVFFLSIGVVLYKESNSFNRTKELLLSCFPLVFGGLFFLSFFTDIEYFENFVYFLVTLGGIIGLLFFSPYIKNIITHTTNQSIYYTFFYKLSGVFLISGILGGLLFGLGAIAIASVFSLFDISYRWDEIYGDWAILSLGFITPLFALTKIPTKKEFTGNTLDQNAFFSFLIKYVAIPFIFIYFIILYAYTIKVLLNFSQWPKGEVSWMVIGFSTFGYIIYMFSYIFEKENTPIKLFRKYFPFAVLPQIAMLFYAIALRIGQYDITINRYFVVIFGIWLTTISLYLIISHKKYLGYIPTIFTCFTIIISIGPWSVYNLPETRQLERLQENLREANILQNGIIVPLENKNDIDEKLSGEIYDGIKYICNLNDCQSIKELFPDQWKAIENQQKKQFIIEQDTDFQHRNKQTVVDDSYREPTKWSIIEDITKGIKVQPYYKGRNSYIDRYIYYHTKDDMFPVNVEGYSSLYKVFSIADFPQTKQHIQVNVRSEEMFFYSEGILLETKDISDIFKKIRSFSQEEITRDDMTFQIDNDLLFIKNVNLPNLEYTGDIDDYYYRIDGYLLKK